MSMKKSIMVSFLFCWCINIYGQESITDATIISDMYWPYFNPAILELIELYEEYETECFNDSTEQCFNYYRTYHLFGSALDSLEFENYKTPCGNFDYDLGIDASYRGTHEEWVHVQPSFIGFMQYLKKKRNKN